MNAGRGITWADVLAVVIFFEFCVVLLAVADAGYFVYSRLNQAAYQAAPQCHSAGPGTDCRASRAASITDRGEAGGKGGGYHWVTTNLPGFAGRQTKVWPSLWDQLYVGEAVRVESWRDRITLINGVETRDNPIDQTQGALYLEIVPASLAVIALVPGVPAVLITRRRRGLAAARSAA